MEGQMIARVWNGHATRKDADAYESMLKPELLPGVSKVKGYRGSYLLRRENGEDVEFITILLWDSLDAIRDFAGPDFETSIVPEDRKKYLSRHDAKAKHYEIVAEHRPEQAQQQERK
jgi:heme-degrading monooxygenase HmoA